MNDQSAIIQSAIILAAGFGTRMKPLTDTMPKPLVKVNGKALITYAFDRLREAKVANVVVNAHYLPEQIEAYVAGVKSPVTQVSDERDVILDTGGGIMRALPKRGAMPFYVLNSDSFWTDGQTPALERLRMAWDDSKMDCLLLLCDPNLTTGYDGKGDFVVADSSQILKRRPKDDTVSPAYMGAYIVHPRLFDDAPSGAFSMNRLWDKAIATGRL